MLETVKKNIIRKERPEPQTGASVTNPDKRAKRHSTPRRTVLFAGLTGFTIGVVFWHIVGFWAFVGDVLMTGSSENSEIISRLERTIQSNRVAGSEFRQASHQSKDQPAGIRTDACTQLVMDRVNRTTYAAPCAKPVQRKLSSSPLQTASRNSGN
ncbi:MAG: hypothetical protein ACR2OW_00995 [Methyloligellaceae bacterium]